MRMATGLRSGWRMKRFGWISVPVMAMLASGAAHAGMADRAIRSNIGGIDVIIYPTEVKDVVTLAGSLPGGDAFAVKGQSAVPTLVGMMLDKGTTKQDKFEISRRLQSVGAQLGFGVQSQTVGMFGRCLRKDVPLLVELLAEQLRTPAFSQEEFDKAKKQLQGQLRHMLDDTGERADDALMQALFAEGHPNRTPLLQDLVTDAPGATLQQIKDFHARYYGPAHMTLVFVGDVDAEQIRSEVAKHFAGWTGGVDAIRSGTTQPRDEHSVRVNVAGKTSVSVLLGQASGITYRDPDSQALRLATSILGTGFTGRLMNTVRVKEGLTYGIGAGLSNDTYTDGVWRISATFAPELADRGIASTRRELKQWWEKGVTAQELAAHKANLIGSFRVGLSTTGGLAGALLHAVQSGYDLSWLDEYPRVIDALTLEQVNGAIRRYLDPDKMVLVEAGTLTAAEPAPKPAAQTQSPPKMPPPAQTPPQAKPSS
jgi:zinc protease